MVPKIEAGSIAKQRQMRQRQIMDAALSLALEGGAPTVTVAAVATKAGLSRSSIYEYFSSSADLIADLILEELEAYQLRLQTAVASSDNPYHYIELWIEEALRYVTDGRHMLVKSLNSVAIPDYRRHEVAMGHRNLMTTIAPALTQIGIEDPMVALTYLQNTLDVAAVRIDSGNAPAPEILSAQRYALAGLRALAGETF